ncbi:TolC family protein [Hymenobacter algoricola]|uniref:TolC family protein n=1 Tax=Hymenobacter algoricola TaxID=486267 RepID=A0ABP7MDZ8_9BACT
MKKTPGWLLLSLLLLAAGSARAQGNGLTLTLDSAVAVALRVSPRTLVGNLEVQAARQLRRTNLNLPNPTVFVENPTAERFVGGFTQTTEFPTVYTRQGQLNAARQDVAEQARLAGRTEVVRLTRQTYLALQFSEARLTQLARQDSTFAVLNAATRRLRAAGEIDLLQAVSTDADARQVRNQRRQAQLDQQNAQRQLRLLLRLPEDAPLRVMPLGRLAAPPVPANAGDTSLLRTNALLRLEQVRIAESQQALRVERARALPGLSFGYLNQGPADAKLYTGVQAGITLPVWYGAYRGQIRAAQTRVALARAQYDVARLSTSSAYLQALAEFQKQTENLAYYEETGLAQAATLASTGARLFRAGETSYYLYIQSLNQAYQIRQTYVDALRSYNEALLELNYLRGE